MTDLPNSEGPHVCLGCGLEFGKRRGLQFHLEHTPCGPLLIEEMLVEQEIFMEMNAIKEPQP